MSCIGLIEFALGQGPPKKRNWAKTAAIGIGAVGAVGAGIYALKKRKPLGMSPKPPSTKPPSPTSPTPKSPSPTSSSNPKPPSKSFDKRQGGISKGGDVRLPESGDFAPKMNPIKQDSRLWKLQKQQPEMYAPARTLSEPAKTPRQRQNRQAAKNKIKQLARQNRKSTKKSGDAPFDDMPLYSSSFKAYTKPLCFSVKNKKTMNIGLIEFAFGQQPKKKKTPGIIGAAGAGITGAGVGLVGYAAKAGNSIAKQAIKSGVAPNDVKAYAKKQLGTGKNPTKFGKKLQGRARAAMAIGAGVGIGAQQFLHRRKQKKLGMT